MDKERNGIMIELTMPNEIYLEDFDVRVRPYLTAEEVISIGTLMVDANNRTEQELILMVNVLMVCTDIPEDVLNGENVDLLFHSGLWRTVAEKVSGIYQVWDYVYYEQDMDRAVAKFLNTTLPNMLDKYIDRLPKDDEWNEVIDKLPKSLNEILELAKEDGNADIIRGALKMGNLEGLEDDKQ